MGIKVYSISKEKPVYIRQELGGHIQFDPYPSPLELPLPELDPDKTVIVVSDPGLQPNQGLTIIPGKEGTGTIINGVEMTAGSSTQIYGDKGIPFVIAN